MTDKTVLFTELMVITSRLITQILDAKTDEQLQKIGMRLADMTPYVEMPQDERVLYS